MSVTRPSHKRKAADNKEQEKASKNVKNLTFYEFYSVILKHQEEKSQIIDKVLLDALFCPIGNNQYQLQVTWPFATGDRTISITYCMSNRNDKKGFEFTFSARGDNPFLNFPFLTLFVHSNGIELINVVNPIPVTLNEDINDILLFMRRVFFPKIKDQKKNEEKKFDGLADYQAYIAPFSGQPHWKRMFQALIAPAYVHGNKYVVGLPYLEQTILVQMSFEKCEPPACTEQALLNTLYPDHSNVTNQRYPYISFRENGALPFSTFYVSVDGKWIGLEAIKASEHLTGEQAINLFKFFCQQILGILNPPDLNDAAHKKIGKINIPLRFFYALAADDLSKATWYMKLLGVEPLTFQDHQAPWNDKLFLSQNAESYYKAIRYLQMLTIGDLKRILPAEKQKLLEEVIKRNSKLNNKNTIKQLTQLVLNKSRANPKEGAEDFALLMNLFDLNKFYCTYESEKHVSLKNLSQILRKNGGKEIAKKIEELFHKYKNILYQKNKRIDKNQKLFINFSLEDVSFADLEMCFGEIEKENTRGHKTSIETFRTVQNYLFDFYSNDFKLRIDDVQEETHLNCAGEKEAKMDDEDNSDESKTFATFSRNVNTLFFTRLFGDARHRKHPQAPLAYLPAAVAASRST